MLESTPLAKRLYIPNMSKPQTDSTLFFHEFASFSLGPLPRQSRPQDASADFPSDRLSSLDCAMMCPVN